MSVGSPFYFLVPEGKPHWSESLLPWMVPAALLIALLLFLLLYQHPPKHLTLQGKQEQHKTFQIMPEPTRPVAPSRPARAQPALPVPHVQPRPRPTPRPQVQPRPRPQVHPLPRSSTQAPAVEQPAPSQPAAAPSTASPGRAVPRISLGRLEEQMDNAARSATAAPALPKFHNPETPAADFYIAGWIQKLERIGDLNYPGEMVGNLKVKVVLNPEGGLQRIIMVQSSGNPKLDAAAEQIIRLSFPYTAFSEQLKKQTRRIEIPLNMHFLGVRQVNVWQ